MVGANMKAKNPNLAVNQLVEQFTGTAYDKLVAIYNSLDLLTDLSDEITQLNNRWQGALSTAPTTRPDGTDLQEGDGYFDTYVKADFLYSNGSWINSNAAITVAEVITIAAEHIVAGDTILTLDGSYNPELGTMMVFVSQVYQTPRSADPAGSYVETDEKTITFPDVELTEGELVTIVYGLPISTVNPVISVTNKMYVAETDNQSLIPLPDGMSYIPGNSNITVHVNGQLMFSGVDYEETSSTSILLSTAINTGDQVVVTQGNLITNQALDNSPIQVLSSLAAFNPSQLTLDSTKPVIVTGGNTVADGSGGLYIHDATVSKSVANGVTVIDAGKDQGTQGTGVGTGCWMRQYEGEISPSWFNSPYTGMAAIKSLKGVSGDTVRILGFYEGTTVGGGLFKYDPSMAATAHNGGTIISSLVTATVGSNSWFNAPASGTGCWVRQEDTELNVDWFGAYLDGISDSTDAFLAAAALGNPKVAVRSYVINQAVVGSFYSFGSVSISGTGSVTSITNLLA